MNRTVLVVAAHSDDEALGCGGAIAKHVAGGDTVHVVFLADGVTSRACTGEQGLSERNSAANQALKILGVKQSYMLGFPDNRMDTVPLLHIVQRLERVVEEVQPQIIYTHHNGDLNIDHRITHQAVLTACRPLPGATLREIYAFEVLSATEWNAPGVYPFLPNVFIDISDYLEAKLRALAEYELEMREPPHSRSIANAKRLAELRGSFVGVNAAEAMTAVRLIQ
ncbi:MAG: PIG-L family deacetylase [Pseudomonadales bacterium]|jgi:LmbE family N-acetylglucosaminyl deacetylase|nr:PIG-L family deacetylase [Pseudomonadales bacterium]